MLGLLQTLAELVRAYSDLFHSRCSAKRSSFGVGYGLPR
jgi:hypothetical protein